MAYAGVMMILWGGKQVMNVLLNIDIQLIG